MRNMYELARQLQSPGVVTTAYFNPTRLTKTLRNMVRKSIASGKHSGGWSSQTKSVRNLIFKSTIMAERAMPAIGFCVSSV